MGAETVKENLQKAAAYFDQQKTGYKTWGDVAVLQVAQRISDSEFLLIDTDTNTNTGSPHHISTHSFSENFLGRIFSTRKRINTILVTRQEYASQLKEEVPAILDDQAQLLGVSIRLAKNESDIVKALKGRFAANISDGRSICVGSSIEDAYVAAQLLEKTAKTWVEAKHIGGAKAINKIEAWFMQQYYLFKYSKEAVKNR